MPPFQFGATSRSWLVSPSNLDFEPLHPTRHGSTPLKGPFGANSDSSTKSGCPAFITQNAAQKIPAPGVSPLFGSNRFLAAAKRCRSPARNAVPATVSLRRRDVQSR
jgi:hypothetical protein